MFTRIVCRSTNQENSSEPHTCRLGLPTLLPGVLFLSVITAPVLSEGAGLSNFTQGAGPMGVGNATVAHHEGISSVYFNPAHQLAFEGVHIEGGVTLIRPQKELDSTITSKTYESESKTYTPIHATTTYRISDMFSCAFTVNNSFGLGSEFPDDTLFRYITTESKLTTWDMNPSVAYRLTENLSLAAGFRVVYSDVSLKQQVPLQSFGQPDGRQSFDSTGTGYGWNLGATYALNMQLTFGASYRSPVNVDISGDLRFQLPLANNVLLGSLFPKTAAESELDLPGQLFLGIAFTPSNKWVVEVAARFEQYSSYEKLKLTTQFPVAGQTTRTIAKDWQDVWGYMFGVSYQTDSGYRFSGGYIYEENPVPDKTFEPAVSGLDKQTLTLGLAKRFGCITGRISYAHDLYEDREITNSGSSALLNGTHSQKNQMLALTLSWQI